MADDPAIGSAGESSVPALPFAPPGPLIPASRPELHPRAATGLVQREALVARLLASTAPVVVLSAPAGSGKTTLLLQWTKREPLPHVWLQVEAAHNDPLVFVADLAAVLRQVAPIDPRIARWTRLLHPPLRERIVPSLRDSLEQASPFLLVLDDAHFLTNTACWEMLSTLVRALPSGARLALGTRTEPRLPLARMHAAGWLLEIGGEELAFTPEETLELLRLRGLDADEEAAAALQVATEGWAAGISLAALACPPHCTPDWAAGLDGGQEVIARYLTSEVLERQSHSVQTFLLETSILARLSDDSCGAVTGRTDAGRLLARLSRDHVFVTALDDRGTWYRYHHLFAELLSQELKRRDRARLPELHRRAALWSEEQGDLEGAVRHWLAAGEEERAGDVVCRGHFLLSSRGQAATVRRWIELFTDEQIRSNATLALTAGWTQTATSPPYPAYDWAAGAYFMDTDDTPLPCGGGSKRAFQATLRASMAPQGVKGMRDDAELAARLATTCHPAWKAVIECNLGVAFLLSDENRKAERALRSAVQLGYSHHIVAEIAGTALLSLLFADQGRWPEAEAEAVRAKRRLEDSELGLFAPLLAVLLADARVLAHSSRPVPQDEMDTIEKGITSFFMPPWMKLTYTVALAKLALDLGDLPQAERWTAESAAQLRAWPDAGSLRTRVERLQKALLERGGTETLTLAERRVLELLATYLTSVEIARKLGVSRNTLKTHLRDLYRKLDVHTRTEAVERAKELGLLRS